MSRILALMILALSQIPNAAHAVDSQPPFNLPFYVMGAGNKSCGTVVKEFKENGLARGLNSAWVSGYLSAFNEYSSNNKKMGLQEVVWVV